MVTIRKTENVKKSEYCLAKMISIIFMQICDASLNVKTFAAAVNVTQRTRSLYKQMIKFKHGYNPKDRKRKKK